MITITLQSENGVEARKELLDLLGLGAGTVQSAIDIKFEPEVNTSIAEEPKTGETEPTKGKRRTKAEIEADKAAEAPKQDVPPAENAEVQTAPEQKDFSAMPVEKVEVQNYAAKLIRDSKDAVSKKAEVKAIIAKYGSDGIKSIPDDKLNEFFTELKTVKQD